MFKKPEQEMKPPLVRCAHDELVDINSLKPHPKNPNTHPGEQIHRLAQILEYQGFRYPIKISKVSGFITSGHGRLMAAKELGWSQVPVNYQDYENEEQEYADLVADNSIANWAELDLKSINECLADLGPDFDIDLLGIKDFALDPVIAEEATPEDQSEKEPVECPSCKHKFII